MKTRIKIAVWSLVLKANSRAVNREKALEKDLDAIQLMDEGKFDESIKLLKQAQKLDPKRYDYPYKMSYAHYAQGDFKGGINILEKLSATRTLQMAYFSFLEMLMTY